MADARRAPLKDQTDISGARALIVEARFYDDLQDALLDGAIAELKAAGLTHDVITVPGALEIPAAVAIAVDAAAANGKPYDAVIALGCVIRGETPHFDYVAGEAAKGIAHVAAETGVPVAFGVLTTNTLEQAIDRAGAKGGNKGFDAAMTAIEMANLLRTLRQAT